MAQFKVDLSWLSKVRSAERIGTVQQESLVGQIYCLQGYPPVFAEALAKRKNNSPVVRKMIRPIAPQKSLAIANDC
jgi:hypothetical protein